MHIYACARQAVVAVDALALVDTPAATVAFLGALTVIVCPALAVALDGRKLGLNDAPQVGPPAGVACDGCC